MSLKVYNVLTRQKEAFEPLKPNEVSMYVCGPTVYDDAHVGHAMSSIVFDIIRRYLEFRGYAVRHVMNYTDVDDKIIIRANENGEDPIKLAERYINQYMDHIDSLNILPATVYPRATQVIGEMIDFIQSLIDKGYAYAAEDGSVYFRVDKDQDYGKLSRRNIEDMVAGARIAVDETKDHPMDFALWKAAKPGEPKWKSPWGEGRPGWHIECSTMIRQELGDQIDIHGGGNDLLFPHHENEMAQTESLTGEPMAKYWIHNGMLQLSGEKMSKSIGNLVRVSEFLDDHPADVFRLIVLGGSYRAPLTFNDEVIEQAENGLARLLSGLRPVDGGGTNADADKALADQIESAREGFVAAMDDDFNTAGALSHLYGLVRTINQGRDNGASSDAIEHTQDTLRELGQVLGLRLEQPVGGDSSADPFIDLLLEIRTELRGIKQWGLSDKIRDSLTELGVIVEDGSGGSSWRWG